MSRCWRWCLPPVVGSRSNHLKIRSSDARESYVLQLTSVYQHLSSGKVTTIYSLFLTVIVSITCAQRVHTSANDFCNVYYIVTFQWLPR